MKKIFIFALIIIIGLSASIVFAMTEIKQIPQPKAYVISAQGEAQLQKSDTNNWLKIVKQMEIITGDTIKTGDNGQVAINFYDHSTSRIGPNSKIFFNKLFIDKSNYAKTKVDINITIGRVWSRIIQLMDKEASFEVGSNTTVATVRGTAFDFEITPEGIAKISTIEDTVEVATFQLKERIDDATGQKIVAKEIISKVKAQENVTATIDQTTIEKLEEIKVEVTPKEVKDSKWFKDNLEGDKEFVNDIKEKQKEMAKEIAGVLPDSPMYKIKKMAEKTRIIFTANNEEQEKLKAFFVSRRLVEAQQLADLGKVELAKRTAQEFKKDIINIDQNKLSEVKNQIDLGKNLLAEVDEESGLLDLKLLIDELKLDVDEETIEETKDKKFEKEARDIDESKSDLETPREVTDDGTEKIDDIIIDNKQITKPEANIAEDLTRPDTEPEKPDADLINLLDTTADETDSRATTETEKIELTGLIVTANKYNMLTGSTKQFKAMAQYSDGSEKDITNLASWSLSGDIGSITNAGLLQTDDDGGKGVINASYTENGITISASSPEVTALTIEF